MLKLKNPINLQPSSFTDKEGKIVKPDPIVLQTLQISFIDIPYRKQYQIRIEGVPSAITLFNENAYSKASERGDITKHAALVRLDSMIAGNPEFFLQQFFPKTLENHPDGAGTILSNFLKKIGITSTPNCICRQHAIEMNEKGNDWCLQNVETIVQWLKEEADKRQHIYQDWCIRALVNRAIKRSIKKCQSSTLVS
jgi:hypothetical protein